MYPIEFALALLGGLGVIAAVVEIHLVRAFPTMAAKLAWFPATVETPELAIRRAREARGYWDAPDESIAALLGRIATGVIRTPRGEGAIVPENRIGWVRANLRSTPLAPIGLVRFEFQPKGDSIAVSAHYLPVGIHAAPLVLLAGATLIVGPGIGLVLSIPGLLAMLGVVWLSVRQMRGDIEAALVEIKRRVGNDRSTNCS